MIMVIVLYLLLILYVGIYGDYIYITELIATHILLLGILNKIIGNEGWRQGIKMYMILVIFCFVVLAYSNFEGEMFQRFISRTF